MKKYKKNFHGSDIEVIEKKYNIQKGKIINFSSNVNPLGLPKSCKDAIINNVDALENYPDRESNSLKELISNYSGCSIENIAVGNGASEVTKVFINIINPKKSLIIAPTYSEYEVELTRIGSDIDYFELKEQDNFKVKPDIIKNILNDNYDLLIICNPNNPTGTLIKQNDMLELVKYCKKNNIFVMVDETYIEFVENFATREIDSVNITNNDELDNLIVLRGISKFYSLPGIRFGYAITNNKSLLYKAESYMNVWSVNSLVEITIESIFNDKNFINASHKFMNTERQKILDRLLDIDNLEFFYPNANFVLVKILNNTTSQELFEKAIQKNMMIRNCESFQFLNNKFFRFCFLNTQYNDMLLNFLEEEFGFKNFL